MPTRAGNASPGRRTEGLRAGGAQAALGGMQSEASPVAGSGQALTRGPTAWDKVAKFKQWRGVRLK